jgi:hypothetical protein
VPGHRSSGLSRSRLSPAATVGLFFACLTSVW